MQIVETSVFTRQVQSLLTDEEYRELQDLLVARPDIGKVIQGSGGLRKVRWTAGKRGKRGGVRIIYYWYVAGSQILMLLIYAKSEQEDLTPQQMKVLRKIVEEEYP
jgi:mRNA-degrading endonuclease RelE of RelBE toxin-antitoxin system